jgi:hypothetical protein
LGEIVTGDVETIEALLASPSLRGPIRDDGTETFARTRTVSVIVEESYERDDHDAPVSVSVFLARSLAGDGLFGLVANAQRRIITHNLTLDRLVRRIGLSPGVEPMAEWVGYLDMAFDSLDDAAAGYRMWRPPFEAALEGLSMTSLTLVSRRCPLYEPMALGFHPWPAHRSPSSGP